MSEVAETNNPSQSDEGTTKTQLPAGELQNINHSYRLNGQNYLKWSQLVRTYLKGKGKSRHLLGTGPKQGDPNFDAWDEEDSMIMSWLWSSMTPEISDTCMFLASAKDIWDALYQTYSKAKDAARVYEVKVKTVAAKQGNKTVTEYANMLQNLWQELDHYRVLKTKCSEDAVILKKFIEKDRVYDFLVGLNAEFDQVRIQILGKEDVPSLNEVIALIRAEESRRGIMLEPVTTDGSAMVAQDNTNRNQTKDTTQNDPRDNLWCTYCKKPRHTKARCWKLHGKPPTSSREWSQRGDQKFQQQAHQVSTTKPTSQSLVTQNSVSIGETSPSHFNQAEIEKLRSLLGSLEQPNSSCSVALSGKSSRRLHASDIFIQDTWIIDSGATDHMTPSSGHFKTYSPCPSHRKIIVADGSVTTVAGVGHIQLSPSLLLKDVLHVPKLSTSLLSIHKLTRDMNCTVLFYPSHCVFQDQGSGKRIGLAKEKGGLYYLDASTLHYPTVKHVFSESCLSASNNDAIWRHHFRFGHPSFTVLKTMFPSLFKTVNVEDFHCDVCEFAKHKRVSFPMSNNKSSFPFYLIHTDLWGPSRIPNVTGARWFVSFISLLAFPSQT